MAEGTRIARAKIMCRDITGQESRGRRRKAMEDLEDDKMFVWDSGRDRKQYKD